MSAPLGSMPLIEKAYCPLRLERVKFPLVGGGVTPPPPPPHAARKRATAAVTVPKRVFTSAPPWIAKSRMDFHVVTSINNFWRPATSARRQPGVTRERSRAAQDGSVWAWGAACCAATRQRWPENRTAKNARGTGGSLIVCWS